MAGYAWVLEVRPGYEEEYKTRHDEIWPEMLDALKKAGIRNYSIFLRDGILFAYFEYVGNDFAADMRAMAADPETQRWWALMEPMQQKWASASAEDWWTNMTEVFHQD